MDATRVLRHMHADQKTQFNELLAAPDSSQAAQAWEAMQPLVKLHEQIEETHLYHPLAETFPPGTVLGDWSVLHDRQVNQVEQLIQHTQTLTPGTPAWRLAVAGVANLLMKHILEEELEVFPRVDEVWDAAHREEVGQQMQAMLTGGSMTAVATKVAATVKPASRRH